MPAKAPVAAQVAVLGATGCIGRAVCTAFSREGHGVLAIARNHAPQISEYRFVPLDVAATDPGKLAEIFESAAVDTIVNAAGGWGGTEEELTYAHVRLVEQLIAATAATPRRPRLVHIGSIHEYGMVAEGTSISETTEPNPTTAYARAKLAGSEAVMRAARAGDIDAVVLKAVNVCGPHTTAVSFLSTLKTKIRHASRGQRVALTIATAKRDFIDVRDLADAVVLAARAPVPGHVINIGRGVATDMRELVTMLLEAAGLSANAIEELDRPVHSSGGGWTQADIRLAEDLLRWRPRISLRESIEAMWTSD